MNKEEAIQIIVTKFDEIKKSDGYGESAVGRRKIEGVDAVWFYISDTAGSYEVDEEWLGVTKSGQIAWAYASGCSCWDGDSYDRYDEATKAVMAFISQTVREALERVRVEKKAENPSEPDYYVRCGFNDAVDTMEEVKTQIMKEYE